MGMYTLNHIPSEAQIERFLRRTLFGTRMRCPECASPRVRRYESRYRCLNCRTKFSLTSHTWLANHKAPLSQVWLLLWCWTQQVPVKQTASLAELSRQHTYGWFDTFRSHLPEDTVILEGLVQLDEAFGRGWTLMLGKQSGSRKLAYALLDLPEPQRQHVCYFLQSFVRPGSRLATDGAGIYRGIEQWWPVIHSTDIHRKFEFGQTSEIEGMFACFRTFIRRMYHHVTAEKVPEYVSEFCSRFSSPELFENPRHYLKKSLTLVPTR